MSILDNIKGRSGDEGESGGKFNPFRLLEIGEIMVRYTDGIRIKDFVFLAILTSERLILIDSARQGTGQITKEIPFSVIKQADLERDERDRPALAISMEVGDQQRVMRLVFTGIIDEPDTECREWYTAINGYPPERVETVIPRLDEPVVAPRAEPRPSAPVQAPIIEAPSEYQAPPEPVQPSPAIHEVRPTPEPEPRTAIPSRPQEIQPPAPEPVVQPPPPVVAPKRQQPSPPARITVTPPPASPREFIPSGPVSEGSIRVFIEKPDLSPIRVRVRPPGERAGSMKTFRYCIHCGGRTPSHARFCPICGEQQS